MTTRKIAKCADTGRIVSTAYAAYAIDNPETTYFLTVKVSPRKKPSLRQAR